MSCDLLNLIGAANIPAVPTKMCRVTPDVFFLPLPPLRRARGAELRTRKYASSDFNFTYRGRSDPTFK